MVAHENQPGPPSAVSLREYFEKLIEQIELATKLALESVRQQQTQHNTAHDREHDSHLRIHQVEKDQLVETRIAMEHRLESLNALRSEVTADRGLLVPRELLDSTVKTLETKIGGQNAEMGKLTEELAQMRGRSAAFAVVVAVLVPVFSIAMNILFTYLGSAR